MPELPEVETIRAQLDPALVGRRIERVEIRDARLTRPIDPDTVGRRLEGERVTGLDRRGKYLIVRFESGRAILIHLRMTGNVRVAAGKTRIVYRDVRRFGTWLLVGPGELEPYLAERLGAEALEQSFRAVVLATRLAGRRAPVKAALLDQRTVAGVGSIYADEALWRARIHPLRPAGELERPEVRRLHRAFREALRVGIARQGATLSNYATPDGESGRMQEEFKVYGREGEPCLRCGTPIEKIRAAGRGTWLCPACQPLR